MATRPPVPTRKKISTPEELRAGIKRLETRIEELEAFDPMEDPMEVHHRSGLHRLESSIRTTLARVFGDGTADYECFLPAADLNPSREISYNPAVIYNRERSLALLRNAVRTLQEDLDEIESTTQATTDTLPIASASSRKVFVVHGRDNDAKNEVARFLGKICLEEIILHERPNSGRHLLTKFQEETEGARFAVVLLTPDDEGGLPGESPRKRARQNVVFELGFFIGKLGASRVAVLVKGGVEKPSDFDGVGYILLDPTGAWKSLLARELKAAKIPFEADKVFEA
jgi:predicted nucleotide-binding protein